jgi:hypothetical protein
LIVTAAIIKKDRVYDFGKEVESEAINSASLLVASDKMDYLK